MSREREFYETLKELFIGAEVEGTSGYINLMKIKSKYFDKVFNQLKEDIDKKLARFPEFREELFDKLYTFFKMYFSESGSIHFCSTRFSEKILGRVYLNNVNWKSVFMNLSSIRLNEYEKVSMIEDVTLFWKTRDLYYVKTDKLWRSMSVKLEENRFFFDASEIEHRKTYEKREVIFELKGIEDGTIIFKVKYSERGKKTNLNSIRKELKKKGVEIGEEVLKRVFRIFERQNEVDYFIHKNAKSFLKEQFDIWLKNYVLDEESIFDERRLEQLRLLKDIAYSIIDFISQFEDEVRKIWEKPKFVLNSNYVITLDKIEELCGKKFAEEVVSIILKNEKQLKEWEDLFGVKIKERKDLVENSGKWKKLPIDTKYFDEEFKLKLLEKITERYDLDEVLDGWLIKSENWQALNTILPKFRGRVKLIYIDPPFNKEQNADYAYNVKYKDSTWITMLENRLSLAKEILAENGSIYVRCDYNGNMYVRLLMNEIFGKENFRNEIVVSRVNKQDPKARKFNTATDTLYFYTKSGNYTFNPIWLKSKKLKRRWHAMDSQGQGKPMRIFGFLFDPPKGRHWTFSQERISQMESEGRIRIVCKKCSYIHTKGKWKGCPNCGNITEVSIQYLLEPTDKKLVDSNWTDIPGYSSNWKFSTENSEQLLKRIIEASSNKRDIIMDFFLGSGTTVAVAQKLGRRWIGVEVGEHFYTVVLPRIKKVLAGETSGITKEVGWRGGGFFKYFELEQFEQSLRMVRYADTEPFNGENIYSQYVFLKDEKMLYVMELDYRSGKIKVDLSKLYQNVDLAETISNLKGKFIRRITRGYVEFEDGERLPLQEPDWKLIKPLIWWY